MSDFVPRETVTTAAWHDGVAVRSGGFILRAHLGGSNVTTIGIWLDPPAGHVYYTGTDVVGRVDLDGSNASVLVRNAGVLTGITGARRR